MKKLGLLLMLFVSLISCSNNDSEDKDLTADYFGKWEQFIDSKFVDASIKPWLFYEFNADNTFVKTSIRDGVTEKATGTYAVLPNGKGSNFTLNYKENSQLITNCYGGLTEDLFLDEYGYLAPISVSCDGFEKYKKAK